MKISIVELHVPTACLCASVVIFAERAEQLVSLPIESKRFCVLGVASLYRWGEI